MRVFVYFNLHKKLWSVRALEGPNKGRVVYHAPHVVLSEAVPKVSEAGRQRVLRDKRKNVHAGIVGRLQYAGERTTYIANDPREITYNPYKYESFVHKDDESVYNGSRRAILTDKRVYV